MTRNGHGVGEVDGNPVLVDAVLPGERLQFRYLRRHRRRWWGATEELIKTFSYSVTPPSRSFGRCGGCSFQHLASNQQRVFKEKRLLGDLVTIGGVEPEQVCSAVTGPTEKYRRKARLGVSFVPGKGRALIGFRERGGSYVADMHLCSQTRLMGSR